MDANRHPIPLSPLLSITVLYHCGVGIVPIGYITEHPNNFIPQYQSHGYSPRTPLGANWWQKQNRPSDFNYVGRGGPVSGNYNSIFFPKAQRNKIGIDSKGVPEGEEDAL